jgi:hypothetical protein
MLLSGLFHPRRLIRRGARARRKCTSATFKTMALWPGCNGRLESELTQPSLGFFKEIEPEEPAVKIIEEITVYHVSRVFVSMSACVCERFRGNLQNALRRRLQCKLKCLHVLMPIQLSRTENEALRGEIDSLQTQLREMQQREKDHLTNCRKLQFQKQVCCCFRPIGS